MSTQVERSTGAQTGVRGSDWSQIAEDGLFSGMIGALTVALWFLILDTISGRPLYTPSLLGKVLFLGSGAMNDPAVVPAMVVVYTGVHMAAFMTLGMIAAWLVRASERAPEMGILLLFLFVIFEASFFVYSLAVGGGLIGRLGVTAVIVANVLAAAAMSAYFLVRRPAARHSLEKSWEQD